MLGIAKKKGAPPATVHQEYTALSAVFNYAIQEQQVVFNPVIAVKKPKIRAVKPRGTPSRDELNKILDHLFPPARRFFLALCLTGCRLNELASAKVGDADLENGILCVVRKRAKVDHVVITESFRNVIKEELAERGPISAEDPLFVNSRGKPYREIKGPLKTACRKAKVPRVNHHNLRPAYATILHEEGVDLETISRLLEHSSTWGTERVYVYWKLESLREPAEKISPVLGR